MSAFIEPVIQDSSPFCWLEDRGAACQLIALIDDATSRFRTRFTEHATTEENLRTFAGWLRRYGRLLTHYIFRMAGPAALAERFARRKRRAFFRSGSSVSRWHRAIHVMPTHGFTSDFRT
jgi:hypothetical protein